MIERDLLGALLAASRAMPVVTLTGPRQSGKSTLCRAAFPGYPVLSLEPPDQRAFAVEDPRGFLAQHSEGVVLDEVQRVPALLSYVQERVDADPRPGRFILTGSQNFALLEGVAQSLAGRTAVLHLLPMAYSELLRFEVHPEGLEECLLAGGYPRIFDRGLDPWEWLGDYVQTYVERDVRAITNVGDLTTFQRFVELCAGRTGQLLNLSSLAADAGVSQPTARSWLSILETSFLVFRLPAHHTNQRKRLVKMPKLYFLDSGLACRLLGIRTPTQLRTHPLRGALFETWVVSEIRKHRTNQREERGLTFYRERSGAEADLVVERTGRLQVLEMKSSRTASPDLFAGVRRVRDRLLETHPAVEVAVIYGGEESQRRSDGARLIPWSKLHEVSWTDSTTSRSS